MDDHGLGAQIQEAVTYILWSQNKKQQQINSFTKSIVGDNR